ncbi:UTP--glucose-1-phosphate uridylyltransferase [Thermococcus radiotolerans]|uniref:UTP--glucose-1-phosphate uridylyltransferase n=1 Tax=Thermococcus radiotolerans TaxID=187880 RepID=A0A2Z2N6N8_9EURY|nr:UTP--glucose-1-phosphate uridylyltransferase [Thermococcus radiotolerans]ASJ15232.1 UTP--glucose-1-phosphate uridylyltransferase [Thermococcus radiotolerans]
MRVRKAVIPAAGLGTRMLPLTKAQPKEMLPVVRKPTIQYIVEEAYAAGIREILIITGKHKRAIEDHFDKYDHNVNNTYLEKLNEILEDVSIYYIRQRYQKGLGDAVKYAQAFVNDEPFALILGDTITIPSCTAELIEMYENVNAPLIAVEEVPWEKVSLYGIVSKAEPGEIFKIESLVEKPDVKSAPSNLAILGRYILTSEIFEYLEKVKPDKKGEIQLTDALELMVKDGIDIYGYIFGGNRYDIGNIFDWLRANIELALKDEEVGERLRELLLSLVGGRDD